MSEVSIIPNALFFEDDKSGLLERVNTDANSMKPLHSRSGFWATVIKCYPETSKKPDHFSSRPTVWLLKKADQHYIVWFEDDNITNGMALQSTSRNWCEMIFETFKRTFIVPFELRDIIMSAQIKDDPEGSGGHWKRAMRLVREELYRENTDIAVAAAALGVKLTKEKLLRRPKHATATAKAPAKA